MDAIINILICIDIMLAIALFTISLSRLERREEIPVRVKTRDAEKRRDPFDRNQ